MSSNHRRKIARALAAKTGMTYQQALAAVITAAENGLLPHTLDKAGIHRAVHLLAGEPAPRVVDLYQQMLAAPHGLILVAGATGSGRTSFVYDCLRDLDANLDAPCKRIVTIEEPVERLLSDDTTRGNITQYQYGRITGASFEDRHRAAHKADPDIIMIDEVRDPERAAAAMLSANTGHLVLTTLHANDAAGAISHLLNLGADPADVANALTAIVMSRRDRDADQFIREVTLVNDDIRDFIRAQAPDASRDAMTSAATTRKALADLVRDLPTQSHTESAANGKPGRAASTPGERVALSTGPTGSGTSPALAAPADPRVSHALVTPPAGHLLITGPTGSGKTVITRDVMRLHRRRGDRILLIDTTTSGLGHEGLADEVATTTAQAATMLTGLLSDDRRTLLVIEDITEATTTPTDGVKIGRAARAAINPTEDLLMQAFGTFTPDEVRIVATTQRGLIEARDKDKAPLGWPSGFDTNVVLGPNATLDRALWTTDRHAPLHRGWAYVEHPDGRFEEVNLYGEEKDRPFGENDREQVRTGLRRLAAMMGTGIQPSPALSTLAQTMTGEAQQVFLRLADASMLSAGASREPHVFEPWTVVMLQNGETGGAIGEAVKAIVDVY